MNDESRNMATSLSLGTIEMPLADLLSLREGSLIEFERPEKVEGVLQVMGSAWAVVQVSFGDERVLVEVKELVSLSQETFQANRRT